MDGVSRPLFRLQTGSSSTPGEVLTSVSPRVASALVSLCCYHRWKLSRVRASHTSLRCVQVSDAAAVFMFLLPDDAAEIYEDI